MLAKKIKIFILFLFYVTFVEINLLKIFFKNNKHKKKIYNNASKLNNFNKLTEDFNKEGICSFDLDDNYIKILDKWNNRFAFIKKINNNFLFKNIINNKDNIYFHTDSRLITYFFFPEVDILINNGPIEALLTSILGSKYKIIDRIYTSKNYQEDKTKELFSNFWHFDWRRIDHQWLRVMIYLNDQSSDECLQYFDKEISRKAIKEKVYNRIKNDDLPPFLKNISKNAKGKKGKVLIVNTADLLHRAGDPILNKSRKTFFIQIKSNKEWEDEGFLKSPAQS